MKRLLIAVVLLVLSSFAIAAVNINTATKEDLDALPGIGPVKAQAIIDYRNANGPFKTPADIMKVKGIKEGEFGKIKDQIAVSGATTTMAPPAKAAEAPKAPAATPSPSPAPAKATEAPKATPAAPAAAPAPAAKDEPKAKMSKADEDKAAKAKAKEDKAKKTADDKAAKEKAKAEKAEKAKAAKEEKAKKAAEDKASTDKSKADKDTKATKDKGTKDKAAAEPAKDKATK